MMQWRHSCRAMRRSVCNAGASNVGRSLCVQISLSREQSYPLTIYWYHSKGNWLRYNSDAETFYIMKLCSRLFVLYCRIVQKTTNLGTLSQGCSLGLDVSVSRRSQDVVSKRLGLVSVSWKRGKVSVSTSSRTENQMSRSRTIGSRLQANMHSFLFHCKIARTSFWMQGVYIVYWFTS